MHIHISFYLIATLTWFRDAHGWKLDKSCQTTVLKPLITKVVKGAFTIATTAKAALTALDDQDVQNVAKWMMLPDNQTPTSANMEPLLNIFKNILDNQETQLSDDMANSDVPRMDFVVYCDMSRFKQRPSDKIWVDTDNDEAILSSDLKLWDDCRTLDATLAFVRVPIRPQFSQLQLCPWFIDWIKGDEYQTFADLTPKAWLANSVVVPLLKKYNWPLTEIDAALLFDKVILHEITHTRGAGSSIDVDAGIGVKYGWNRCRNLAQEGLATNNARSPVKNADSIALVGSGIRFIKATQSPRRVTIDGLLEPIT